MGLPKLPSGGSLAGGLAVLGDDGLEAGGAADRVEIGVGLDVDQVLPAGPEGQAKRLEGALGVAPGEGLRLRRAGASATAPAQSEKPQAAWK